MYLIFKFLLIFFLLNNISYNSNVANGQRGLLNWQKDLQYRLGSYRNQLRIIDDIIRSSIYSAKESINGTARVTAKNNVRFSDLIIPKGALILDSPVARPAVGLLLNRTQGYVNTKLRELAQVDSQLLAIRSKLHDPVNQFIYKGRPNMPVPQINFTLITGTRVFKQFQYARMIDARNTDLKLINYTNVEHVINETYMENPKFKLVDSEGRLFFDGRKTLWRSVFQRQLQSGCCDRLKPLHTNRMMRKSTNQEILAPVMFQPRDPLARQLVVIRNLASAQLYNRILTVGYMANRPQDTGLVPSIPENYIQINQLVGIKQLNQPEILKTIVFKDIVLIDDAQVHFSPDNKLLIDFASPAGLRLDLDHSSYLLKFSNSRNTTFDQKVAGRVVINGDTHFINGLFADVVNQVPNFDLFLRENVVRIDRPAIIRGSVQFNALPSIFPPTSPSRPPHNVPILQVIEGLDVGLLNGMRLPYDVVILPPATNAIKPFESITIRGPRLFTGQLRFGDLVQVRKQVNGLNLPDGVIPLHLHDFMSSVGSSNIWFMNGISVHHLTIQGGQLDDIMLRDVHGDAQSLLVRSAIVRQPDGTDLIRAPLRVLNLRLLGVKSDQGLLNGFRPEDVIELARHQVDTVMGKKTFLAPVEAIDCFFNDINQLANWTNHLIRIDRPNTVQTIYTKPAFVPPIVQMNFSSAGNYQSPQLYNPPSSINITRLDVEFYPNNNPQNYLHNLNFSPELYILHQALARGIANQTGGRIRVLDRVELPKTARINGIFLDDIVTLDKPFRFADRFVMVGKVEVRDSLRADRITSNYPIESMDIVQFDKYRIPILGSRSPIKLNNLALSINNQASFVRCQLLNGVHFTEFVNSIMSLTRPQQVQSSLVFGAPVNLDGMVRTESSLNGIKDFRRFARELKTSQYSFEDGLQCNTVVINT